MNIDWSFFDLNGIINVPQRYGISNLIKEMAVAMHSGNAVIIFFSRAFTIY